METCTIRATIPTVQYGNLQPEVTVTAPTYEEAKTIALARIQDIWDAYGEKPLAKKSGDFKIIETFTGEKIKYNADTHIYTDMDGNKLISGSEYKKSFDKPFDTALLSGKVSTKYGVPAETVAAMWKANGRISTTFGSAIHYALEQWFKYKDSACADKEYNLPKHPFLRNIVQTFPLRDQNVLPELMVSCVAEKMAGQIDGLVVTGEKEGFLIDYKSDADIKKNLDGHFKQLSFYADILRRAGWSISGLVVYNYTTKWEAFESEVLEVTRV